MHNIITLAHSHQWRMLFIHSGRRLLLQIPSALLMSNETSDPDEHFAVRAYPDRLRLCPRAKNAEIRAITVTAVVAIKVYFNAS